jgi:hypothetical protein
LVLLDFFVQDTQYEDCLLVEHYLYVGVVLSVDHQLPLPASCFVVLLLPTPTHGGVAAGSDK